MSSKRDDDDYEADDKYDRSGEGKEDNCHGAKGGADIAEEKCVDNLSDTELLDKIQEYFYSDHALTKSMEKFVKERASIIDVEASERNEYKLEYTKAYEDFKVLFEELMETYIEKELKSSIQRFYKILKSKMAEDAFSNEAIFGQILIAVTDFDVFMTMMREEAKGLPAFFK
jgi:hypothetical protein